MSAEPDTVYRSSSTRRTGRKLHADRDCVHLQRVERVNEKPADVFPADEPKCTDCWGDANRLERMSRVGKTSGETPWTCPLCGEELIAAERPHHLEGHP